LGNSPDLLELLARYGTDAVRFSLLYLAPLGQDIRFAEASCEIGRNFANKLWNATRFVIMKRDEYQAKLPATTEFESEAADSGKRIVDSVKRSTPHSPLSTIHYPLSTLSDKWIISRANRAARDIRKAFDNYEINEATKVLYDFVWGDFCDWYLEIVKLQPDSVPLAVEILEGILRLLHPIMPFVTEELWHALTGVPEDVLLGRDDYITPDTYKIDDEAEREFLLVQKTVEAARLIRSTLNLPPSASASIVVQARNAEGLRALQSCSHIIERLARASELTIEAEGTEYSSREYTSELVGGDARVFVKQPTVSVADRAKEHERLSKELVRVRSQFEQVTAKLSNDGFLARAPEQVVLKEREKQSNYADQIEKLEGSLKELA
ncbi:MAG: class I tRNA ligase family protein, partial [Bacteroidota bacterium]|nr:class I tRNA ligase family protein [Bacteroidota bacterium]